MTVSNCAGTPEGSRDLLFDECARRRDNEREIAHLLSCNGYSEVMTPALEFYDTILQSGSPISQQAMLKLVDREGRLLVMRPDNTAPIARLVGTRLKNQAPPFRLYYSQPVYRSDVSHTGRDTQRWQMGLELIGLQGIEADAEILRLAMKLLAACGIDNAQLELGHADCFNSLAQTLQQQAQELGLPAPDIATYRELIAQKNFPALEQALDGYQRCPAAEVLHRLVMLFGGREVLDEARRLQLSQPVDYLEALMAQLPELPISLDLGLIGPLNYYTGLMFQIFIPETGAAVVTGGRYDTLLAQFGRDLPAVGFACDLDLLSEVTL